MSNVYNQFTSIDNYRRFTTTPVDHHIYELRHSILYFEITGVERSYIYYFNVPETQPFLLIIKNHLHSSCSTYSIYSKWRFSQVPTHQSHLLTTFLDNMITNVHKLINDESLPAILNKQRKCFHTQLHCPCFVNI